SGQMPPPLSRPNHEVTPLYGEEFAADPSAVYRDARPRAGESTVPRSGRSTGDGAARGGSEFPVPVLSGRWRGAVARR
ncbi:hypothetical protein ABZ686_14580, partial [Streptomyces sp. NPDC006992]|uniref:hypothetical protein n=1 Tax=Streptomyces sp. NPDC006992 TaxID=3155601 RepID=UPI0033C6382E